MLSSSRIYLRPVCETDINETYLRWLNNPAVNSYLETRFQPQTLSSLHSYWLSHRDDASSPWFAICLAKQDQHIGNIKLGPINWFHRRGDVSIFIGHQPAWGQGYATEAIKLLSDWAFKSLNLCKLNAGIYAENIGSRRAFEKCGFLQEGTFKDEAFIDGRRTDVLRYGLSFTQYH